MLTDEVWRQLDPMAGQLPRRQRRRLVLGLAALVVAAQVGYVAWFAGLLVPKIHEDAGRGSSITTAYPTLSYSVSLRNGGWLPVEVVGWGTDRPGLEQVGEPKGVTLRPGESHEITVSYRVTDCDALTNDPAPVPVKVARFWGTQTVSVALPRQLPPGHSGWWEGEPPMEWELYWATITCTKNR